VIITRCTCVFICELKNIQLNDFKACIELETIRIIFVKGNALLVKFHNNVLRETSFVSYVQMKYFYNKGNICIKHLTAVQVEALLIQVVYNSNKFLPHSRRAANLTRIMVSFRAESVLPRKGRIIYLSV
jgi:hypothetical protein